MEKRYISTVEAAKILGMTRTAVLKRIKAGTLKAEKIGRNYAIAKDDLPINHGGVLTDEKKEVIKKAVEKTVQEYGETLKMLGKE